MSVRAAYAQAPWAGTVLPAPVVGQLPPPIPGVAARFSYISQAGAYPWAFASWAGGYPPTSYPGGGVLAQADPGDGVMAVSVWWPNTTTLQVIRIGSDGARTPVRGAYPLTITAATRRNLVTNPSVETGLNGYVPDVGAPTLSQLADAAAPDGASVLRATVAGAGSCGVTVPTTPFPTAFTGVAGQGGQSVTLGWAMRLSAKPTTVTATLAWTNAAGGTLATSTITLSADDVSRSVNQWARQVGTVVPPAAAISATLKIIATGVSGGFTQDLDAITLETGSTNGSYFDGGTLGGIWLGTPELSASILAPVLTVLDGECPLDSLVSYQVSAPGLTGGRVVSEAALLPSQGGSWLTHPLTSGSPVPVQLEAVPTLVRSIRQGVFWPLSGANPIVVSDTTRHSPNGQMSVAWLDFPERDTLLALLADGSALLLRTPAEFGYEPAVWLAFGDVAEDRGNRRAWQAAGVLKADFHVVARPVDS